MVFVAINLVSRASFLTQIDRLSSPINWSALGKKHREWGWQGIIQEFNLGIVSHMSITLWCKLCIWGIWGGGEVIPFLYTSLPGHQLRTRAPNRRKRHIATGLHSENRQGRHHTSRVLPEESQSKATSSFHLRDTNKLQENNPTEWDLTKKIPLLHSWQGQTPPPRFQTNDRSQQKPKTSWRNTTRTDDTNDKTYTRNKTTCTSNSHSSTTTPTTKSRRSSKT